MIKQELKTETIPGSKLLNLLEQYQPYDPNESQMKERMINFIQSTEDCFSNYHPEGHITASAWILDKEEKKVGLVNHKKLEKWLQPGGHSDGNPDTPQEALREAQEEFGEEGLILESENIFDIDIHPIKEDKKRGLGTHYHYDVRFIILGDSKIQPKVSNESTDVKWIDLDEIEKLNNKESIMRMVRKTKELLS